MPLTEAQRRRLFRRLEILERSRDDFIDLQVAELSRAYECAPPVKVRVSRDVFQAHCDCCGAGFHLVVKD